MLSAHLQEAKTVAVFVLTSCKQDIINVIITKVNASGTYNNSIEERDSTQFVIIIIGMIAIVGGCSAY